MARVPFHDPGILWIFSSSFLLALMTMPVPGSWTLMMPPTVPFWNQAKCTITKLSQSQCLLKGWKKLTYSREEKGKPLRAALSQDRKAWHRLPQSLCGPNVPNTKPTEPGNSLPFKKEYLPLWKAFLTNKMPEERVILFHFLNNKCPWFPRKVPPGRLIGPWK